MTKTLIIPTLNEEKGIAKTIQEYRDVLGNVHILVVDGLSTDKTVDIARMLGAEVLIVREKGKGRAIAHALSHLRKNDEPETLIITDADYTYPADRLPLMIDTLTKDTKTGAVLGNRFPYMHYARIMSDMYLIGNYAIRYFYRKWRNILLQDPLTGLRVIRWEAIMDWHPISQGFEIETEMNLYLLSEGWCIQEIPINYRKRIGEKKLKVKDAYPILKMLKEYPTAISRKRFPEYRKHETRQ